MIKNIIFDYGAVLIDWNPMHLYVPYFHGDAEKARWFLQNICTSEWNGTLDGGKSFDVGVAELTALHPEWADAIAAFCDRWKEMVSGPIPGTADVALRLKAAGYHIWGLSNWNWDTFCSIRDDYPILTELEGMVVSGREGVVKPDEAIYRLLLDRYHLVADECLFVDDNPANTASAERLGIHTHLFSDAQQLEADLRNGYGIVL